MKKNNSLEKFFVGGRNIKIFMAKKEDVSSVMIGETLSVEITLRKFSFYFVISEVQNYKKITRSHCTVCHNSEKVTISLIKTKSSSQRQPDSVSNI